MKRAGYQYTATELRTALGEHPFEALRRRRKKAIAALNRRRQWLFAALKVAGVKYMGTNIPLRIYQLEDAATKKGAASARWAMARRRKKGDQRW